MLRDIITGLADCSALARRLRYRCRSFLPGLNITRTMLEQNRVQPQSSSGVFLLQVSAETLPPAARCLAAARQLLVQSTSPRGGVPALPGNAVRHTEQYHELMLPYELCGGERCAAGMSRAHSGRVRYEVLKAWVWARLAAFTVKQKGFAAVAPLVPHLMRRIVEQAGAERAGAELDEMAGAPKPYVICREHLASFQRRWREAVAGARPVRHCEARRAVARQSQRRQAVRRACICGHIVAAYILWQQPLCMEHSV